MCDVEHAIDVLLDGPCAQIDNIKLCPRIPASLRGIVTGSLSVATMRPFAPAVEGRAIMGTPPCERCTAQEVQPATDRADVHTVGEFGVDLTPS